MVNSFYNQSQYIIYKTDFIKFQKLSNNKNKKKIIQNPQNSSYQSHLLKKKLTDQS